VTRSADVTSDEKSTWPGESMRLMRKGDFSLFSSDVASREASLTTSVLSSSKYSETPVDLMVIVRSCSSARVSMKRTSPADWTAIMPAAPMSESVRVDLPWSTCAMTDMLRML
jgi:hypothetical protein